MNNPVQPLTKEQINFFHENGYLKIEAITTPEDVEDARRVYDQLFQVKAGRSVGDHYDLAGRDEEGKPAKLEQLLNPSKYAPELRDTLMWRNAEAMLKQLLGPEATLHSDHAINKPARVGVPTPWHQDEAYWDPVLEHFEISVWIPLQPATLQNGCMNFVPGSHKLEVIPHQPIGNDPRVIGLEVVPDTFDFSRAVACELPPGGATFHPGRTLHYTSANLTDEPRRALILMGGLPAKPLVSPRRFEWLERQSAARSERANG
jgi:ectoine hydroxylase-related dioxygenase (phytanoyl-CoA dioxygenase family)